MGVKFGGTDISQAQQGIMQFLGASDTGPGFFPNPGDGTSVQQTVVTRLRGVGPAAIANGVGTAFLERRVIQKSVGPGVDNFLGKR